MKRFTMNGAMLFYYSFIGGAIIFIFTPTVHSILLHCPSSLHATMKLLTRQLSIPLELHDSGSVNDYNPFSHPYCSKTAVGAATAFVNRLKDSSKPKMVVFDKDGTLGDCSGSLSRWVHHMTSKIESMFAGAGNVENLVHVFHTEIGWNAAANDVVPSAPVAAGTWDDIVSLVYEFLVEHQDLMDGTSLISRDLVMQWHLELGDLHEHDTPLLEDLAIMMKACQELGYTVAICTSDDRAGTNKAMKRWGIDHVVQFSICGNEVQEGKPSALPLRVLCQQASSGMHTYHPHDCIVVGDTTSDTGMARAARAGFCIGVLTGSGTVDQLLDSGAHLILPDVGYVPSLLKSFQQQQLSTETSPVAREISL